MFTGCVHTWLSLHGLQAVLVTVAILALALARSSAASDIKVPAQGGDWLKRCGNGWNSACHNGTGIPFDFKCADGYYINSVNVTWNGAISTLGPVTCTQDLDGSTTVSIDGTGGSYPGNFMFPYRFKKGLWES